MPARGGVCQPRDSPLRRCTLRPDADRREVGAGRRERPGILHGLRVDRDDGRDGLSLLVHADVLEHLGVVRRRAPLLRGPRLALGVGHVDAVTKADDEVPAPFEQHRVERVVARIPASLNGHLCKPARRPSTGVVSVSDATRVGAHAPLTPPCPTRIPHSHASGSAASLNSDLRSERRLAALHRIDAPQIPIPSAQYAAGCSVVTAQGPTSEAEPTPARRPAS